MGSPSPDQLRLLHIVHRFTREPGARGKRRWMKDLPLSIVVYHGIQRGLFDDYDWAPSLVEFHGVKMYGKVSQEAHADLKRLQTDRLVEKLHLSTCLYDSIRAYRSTPEAIPILEALPEACRSLLDALLDCEHCGGLKEVLAYVENVSGAAKGGDERNGGQWRQVRNATVAYCPKCCSTSRGANGPVITSAYGRGPTRIDFFDIAGVAYRSRPTVPGGFF